MDKEENMIEEVKSNDIETATQNVALEKESDNKPVADNGGDKLVDTTEEKVLEPVHNDEEDPYAEARANAKWYVLHTYSAYENVAKENLEIVKDKYNLQDRIFDIIIPMEDVVEEKDGKRKIVSRKQMPGYIIVKMNYGDDIWHAVTRTRGITGFVGPKGRPLPLTEDEIRKMRLEKTVVIDTDIKENDKVEVLEGALNGFVGTVLSVDLPTTKCRVMVEMFGRETPVELKLDQVRKID